jgi:hypothetical protein
MAVDSQTSATTPAAAPAQPHERPGAATPPAAGAATPPPAGASPASPSTTGSPSPPTEVSPAAPATGDAATGGPQTADGQQPAAEEQQPGFGSRGRRRRRARFLRKARELAYRDLGGLVFSLHRFGQRNDSLVLAKLATLSRIDAELRALEASLGERQPVTVLREAGITACPRCAAIHSGEDRFCPGCGLSMSRRSDLPIAGAPASGAAQPSAPSAPSPSQAPPAGSPLAGAPPAMPPTPPAAQAPAGTSVDPATQQHAAAAAPTSGQAQPHAAPQPATQAFDAIPADSAGRSPSPPRGRQAPDVAPAREEDQPTEIIRPPAPGS